MKYRIYNHVGNPALLKADSEEILRDFEFVQKADLSFEDIVAQKYDVIEMLGSDYENFKPYIPAIDWKTNHLGLADCLILKNGKYKPFHLLADTIIQVLKKNAARINSQLPVIVVGESAFVYSVVAKLAMSGFIEIIVSVLDIEESKSEAFEKKIKSFVFDLNIKTVGINDLTSINHAGFLLISNFKKEKNKDAYDLITYFNFLSEGAVFVDCNSLEEGQLVEEARKAEIFVIDELEIMTNKYNNMREILKNSP